MRRAVAVAAPLLVIFLAVAFRAGGPSPRPLNAPTTEFSAARASETLVWLIDQGIPHPLGTRANALVRSRLVSQFRSLGYETHVQRRFVCNASAECGFVENVIAEAGPTRKGDAIAVVAHYDSVGAGAGASDDVMGVAALLEIARALKDQKLRNRVIFLATDGEEAGLLGAEAFVADESRSKDVAVVVNIENRGTYGASNLFETSRGNRWLIRHLAGALPHPQATSLFPAIYDILPNDTDVSVFRRAGKAAVNFAAIRGINWYHTPLDDVEHASPRTLQHHGENALAAVRALGGADLGARSNSDAVYFDILGLTIVWWPAGWTPWLALLSLALLVFAARREAPREMTFGVLTTFAAIVLSPLAGAALAWVAGIRSHGTNWVAYPGTLIASMWIAGLASAFFAAALFRSRAETRTMLYGTAIVWHVVALALAVVVPGASFLFLVPAVVVTVAALARISETATTIAASSAAAIVLSPGALMLYDALGSRLAVSSALTVGIFATLLAPLFGRWVNATAAMLVALLCAATAAVLPTYSGERPQKISIAYVDDERAASPVWSIQSVTPELERAAKFEKRQVLPPWQTTAWAAPAQRAAVPRVQLLGRREGNRLLIRVRTARHANRIALLVKGSIRDLRIGGIAPAAANPRGRSRAPSGWTSIVSTGGDLMLVELTASGPVELIASDTSYGIPGGGGAIARARNSSGAIQAQDGDVTITRAHMNL